jgi:hypothetical protein
MLRNRSNIKAEIKGSGIGIKLRQGSLFSYGSAKILLPLLLRGMERAGRILRMLRAHASWLVQFHVKVQRELYFNDALAPMIFFERGFCLDIEIREDERLDDLQYKGLRLIQKKKGFCFGVDAVLLSHFAQVTAGSRVIDLGTGTGIIAVLLAARKNPREVTGLEIKAEIVEMARRSIEMNGLGDRVDIVLGDIKEAVKLCLEV